jgi:3-deoxy-D-manno-octulosonic-acid transferase
MSWLFNALYLLIGIAWAPFGWWRAVVRKKPVAGLRQKFTGRVTVSATPAPRIWLHAVSVGEVNVLVHLLPQLQQSWPGWQFVVSTTTQTGHELACRRFGPTNVIYFPFDFSWSVAAAFDRIQPRMIVLTELEIWPNLLREAQRRAVPVTLVNGRLSAESFRS